MNAPLSARLPRRSNSLWSNAYDRLFRSETMVRAGKTPYEVVHDNGLVKLRHYLPLSEKEIPFGEGRMAVSQVRHRVPLVIVPPLAINMYIYDLFPEKSLVRYLLARGFDVYLIDWGVPDRRYTHYDMKTYVADFLSDFLARVRAHSGQQELSLHAWSMSGMFTLAYAGLGDDQHIRNIVLLGTPVNSHASGPLGRMYYRMNKTARAVKKLTGLEVHDINPNFFYSPGWANVLGFKLTNPVGSVQGYWELLKRLGDREFVESHATNSAFLDNMVPYPGRVTQDVTVRVWMQNQFSQGEMPVGERVAKLSNITANLLAIAGAADTMVTPEAARPVLDVVSSQDKQFVVGPGGHMGIVAGSKAPAELWPLTADWLAARSN